MKKLTFLLVLILACLLTSGLLVSCSDNSADTSSTAGSSTANSGVDIQASTTDGEYCIHAFGEWITLKNASCADNGIRERYCYYCDAKITMEIPAPGHIFTDATCISPQICTVCNAVNGTTVAHIPVTISAVKQTCTSEGFTEGSKCYTCGQILVEPVKIPCHTPVKVPAVDATCEKDGLTEGEKCAVCDEILVAQITVPSHKPVVSARVEPTCVSYGYTQGTECEICKATVSGKFVIPMIEHNYVNGKCTGCENPEPTVGITYSLTDDDSSYYVSSISRVSNEITSIIISSTYNGKLVTGIAASAFAGDPIVTSVFIPSTVTYIEDGAFINCSALQEINIPTGVKEISADTFQGCKALLVAEGGVYYVGTWAVGLTGEEEEIIIKDGTTGIASNAFEHSLNIKKITIPASVTYIGSLAFNNCSNLESATIENTSWVAGEEDVTLGTPEENAKALKDATSAWIKK